MSANNFSYTQHILVYTVYTYTHANISYIPIQCVALYQDDTRDKLVFCFLKSRSQPCTYYSVAGYTCETYTYAFIDVTGMKIWLVGSSKIDYEKKKRKKLIPYLQFETIQRPKKYDGSPAASSYLHVIPLYSNKDRPTGCTIAIAQSKRN